MKLCHFNFKGLNLNRRPSEVSPRRTFLVMKMRFRSTYIRDMSANETPRLKKVWIGRDEFSGGKSLVLVGHFHVTCRIPPNAQEFDIISRSHLSTCAPEPGQQRGNDRQPDDEWA